MSGAFGPLRETCMFASEAWMNCTPGSNDPVSSVATEQHFMEELQGETLNRHTMWCKHYTYSVNLNTQSMSMCSDTVSQTLHNSMFLQCLADMTHRCAIEQLVNIASINRGDTVSSLSTSTLLQQQQLLLQACQLLALGVSKPSLSAYMHYYN